MLCSLPDWAFFLPILLETIKNPKLKDYPLIFLQYASVKENGSHNALTEMQTRQQKFNNRIPGHKGQQWVLDSDKAARSHHRQNKMPI